MAFIDRRDYVVHINKVCDLYNFFLQNNAIDNPNLGCLILQNFKKCQKVDEDF